MLKRFSIYNERPKRHGLIGLCLFVNILTLSTNVRAELTDFTISGAVSKTDVSTATAPIIYAGRAGTTCSPSGTSTCNNCTGAALDACNPAYVDSNVSITFSFKTSVAGTIRATASDGTSIIKTGSTIAASASGTIDVQWSAICGQLSIKDTTCATNDTGSIRVGVDTGSDGLATGDDYITVTVKVQAGTTTTKSTDCSSSNSDPGLCSFELFPGDGKAYIIGLNVHSTFPQVGSANVQFKKVQFFYLPGACASVASTFTNASPSKTANFTQTNETSLDTDSITGLENGINYCIRAGLIDEAGNLNYFTSTDSLDTYSGGVVDITPEEVIGLLTADKCFIATAAWGSLFESHVHDLRNFRDQFLLTNSFGKKFVEVYYTYSPQLAQQIQQNENLRFLTRTLLWPIWAFAWLSLHAPWVVLGFAVLLGMALWGRIRWRA